MELRSLTCPNCGAKLNIENGIDSFYCQYCGYHIYMEGQSDEVVKAKIDLEKRKAELKSSQEWWDKQREKELEELKILKGEKKGGMKNFAIFSIIMIIWFIVLSFFFK